VRLAVANLDAFHVALEAASLERVLSAPALCSRPPDSCSKLYQIDCGILSTIEWKKFANSVRESLRISRSGILLQRTEARKL
jgi:hypothetical protein